MVELLGLRIFNLRKHKGMSQTALAKGIISNSYLSNIEKGSKFPGQETLEFLSKRLDVSRDELLIKNETNPSLERQLEEIFTYLLADDWLKANELLAKIKHVYSLEKEPPFLEIGYYLLLGAFLYKNNFFEKAEDITNRYLLGVDKVMPAQQKTHFLNQYYVYFCAHKAIYQRNCQRAVYHLEKIRTDPFFKQEMHPFLISELIFCYQYFGDYEKAMALIQAEKVKSPFLPITQQKIAIKLFYLEGMVSSDIHFYQQAEQCFRLASNLLERFPEMAPQYLLSIQYQQLQLLIQRGMQKEVTKKMATIYHMIMKKEAQKISFSSNDYAVMMALSIDYLEMKSSEKGADLFKLVQPVQEAYPVLKDMLRYAQALYANNEGNDAYYTQQMMYLLSRMNDTWPSTFSDRVRQQASFYFSQKLQYKKAYTILMENQS